MWNVQEENEIRTDGYVSRIHFWLEGAKEASTDTGHESWETKRNYN
jgi:hypothetical protein